MPASDSPAVLVARFLKTNNYTETLDVFLQEAGLPYDAANVGKNDITIEKVLEEKKTFDLSLQFEKLGTDATEDTGWRAHAPVTPRIVDVLPLRSNLLHVSIASSKPEEDSTYVPELYGDQQKLTRYSQKQYLLAASASRRLHVLDTPSLALRHSHPYLHDAPILSCAYLADLVLSGSMSGQLVLSTLDGQVLDKRRDHGKYIVQVVVQNAIHSTEGRIRIATAGWDGRINLYRPDMSSDDSKIGDPIGSISLPSNPESLLIHRNPDTLEPVLILTRRDSTFLWYYSMDSTPKLLGRQNLAPHSNAWIAFTPSAMALSPIDDSVVAVATSAVPHMKLLIARLMFPTEDTAPLSLDAAIPTSSVRASLLDEELDGHARTAASQARAALALQDREAAAIHIHCNTLSPQTPYSTPALAWRPDGSGVWVNSDDGVVRGIEVKTGKVVSTLKGHEPGSKVRCLCTGIMSSEGTGNEVEFMVSGGFDQKLIVWTPETTT